MVVVVVVVVMTMTMTVAMMVVVSHSCYLGGYQGTSEAATQLEFQGVERFLRHVDKCGWEYDQRFLVRMLMMARVVLGSSFWQLGCNSVGLSRCVKP